MSYTKGQTYRDKIQELIETIESIYDDAGWLRDCAVNPEKNAWNTLRSKTREASSALRELDDLLPESRAKMTL